MNIHIIIHIVIFGNFVAKVISYNATKKTICNTANN